MHINSKIKKIDVSTGVFWVEIAELNFYMLCGCPADSVKYLMKKGLIVSINEGNISYENGPNAILLSDVMIQNGSFSNLAEFPVLQMLYRQGMILPNHPNNDGSKPLLIGSQEQIDAQMDYIYRGNYGLTSVEELADSGMSMEEAEKLMDIKLKFAFGKIQPSASFLDSVVIGSQKTQITDELFIQRNSLNNFTLFYKDESCDIDLNLKANQSYDIPYPLGFQDIRREYFGVIHSGEGDGWDINRPCAASILMYQGKIYLIDAGPNINHSLNALGISIGEIEGIFHTHSHDDHFSGLTTLMRSDHKIKYYASSVVRTSVSKKISALLSVNKEKFSDFFDIHDLKLGEWNNIDGLEVKPILSPHPVETNIFVFRTMGVEGYKTYAHFADIVSMSVLNGMLKKDEDSIGIERPYYDAIKGHYFQKVDLKKIDIGGGLIHGNANDFINDASSKIILSHTALPLNNMQKSIGSEAPFGTVDTLVSTYRDYHVVRAKKILMSYFQDVELQDLEPLLNNEKVTFNPGSIIIKEKEYFHSVYLMISGNVSQIYAPNGSEYTTTPLSSGLIGEYASLRDIPSDRTYRAESFVTALKIPAIVFQYFVKKQQFHQKYEIFFNNLNLLQNSSLFQAEIAGNVFSEIAFDIQKKEFESDVNLALDQFKGKLFFIEKGEVEVSIAEYPIELLRDGDFINENVIFDKVSISQARTKSKTTLYSISASKLKQIPVVLWKILEVSYKRYAKMLQVIQKHISGIEDIQYKELQQISREDKEFLEAVLILYFIKEHSHSSDEHLNAINYLLQIAKDNFNEQESKMILYHYDNYKVHRKAHKEFISLIKKGVTQVENEHYLSLEIINEIANWMQEHIIDHDKEFEKLL